MASNSITDSINKTREESTINKEISDEQIRSEIQAQKKAADLDAEIDLALGDFDVVKKVRNDLEKQTGKNKLSFEEIISKYVGRYESMIAEEKGETPSLKDLGSDVKSLTDRKTGPVKAVKKEASPQIETGDGEVKRAPQSAGDDDAAKAFDSRAKKEEEDTVKPMSVSDMVEEPEDELSRIDDGTETDEEFAARVREMIKKIKADKKKK